jgi:putative ABC transport system permease protein
VLTLFSDFFPPGVVFHPLDPTFISFISLLILATTLLSGLYPAIVLSSYAPVLSLKGEAGPPGGEKWWLRKGLIVFQFSISLIFIISALVTGRQIPYMMNTDLRFKTDAVLAINTSQRDSLSSFFRQATGKAKGRF